MNFDFMLYFKLDPFDDTNFIFIFLEGSITIRFDPMVEVTSKVISNLKNINQEILRYFYGQIIIK